MQTLLSDFITEIVLDENLDFEIQQTYVFSILYRDITLIELLSSKIAADMFIEDDPRVLQSLGSNRDSLCNTTKILIDRITAPNMMDLVPEELR